MGKYTEEEIIEMNKKLESLYEERHQQIKQLEDKFWADIECKEFPQDKEIDRLENLLND